jgi:hypothetical protein
MAESPIQAPISGFLSSLKHTGGAGFEGFIAALCESATGQRFRLSASGQQTGQDARSEPGNGNRIKIETKHYSRAALDLRELTAELWQAITLGPETDLWVLAASCRVNDQHAAALEAMANERGIEVLFLDLGIDGLPRVAVFMASQVEAVQRRIVEHDRSDDTGPMRLALEQLRADQRFATDSETSWGAWQVMMRCGDERFFLWGSLGTTPADPTMARRTRFVTAREDQTEQKLGREKERKETLFGMKIERGELFPFLAR